MGLRAIRIGETARVKVGAYTGCEGRVLDVGQIYAMIELGDEPYRGKVITVKIDDIARLVDSATDIEDLKIAKGQFAQIDIMLARIADGIEAFEQAQIEEAARAVGLPEEILIAIGLLPEAKRVSKHLPGDVGDLLKKIVSGLASAATVIGIGKPVVEKLLGE